MPISTLHRGQPDPRATLPVRQRCDSCDVAWTGPIDTPCWFCEEDGRPVNGALARQRAALDSLEEFDLSHR